MGELPDLTVKERALIHLYLSRVTDWDADLPDKLTQKGIAKGVGVSRAHISQTLISLEKEGFVKSKKSRIKGHARKKKAYKLQEKGRRKAEKLYNLLLDEEITLIMDGEPEKYRVKLVLDKIDISILEIYKTVKEEGRLVISEAPKEKKKSELDEEIRSEEKIPEKRSRLAAPIFSFIILGIFAVLNLLNIEYIHDETLLCLYPFGFIIGLIPISYFFYSVKKRFRYIEQVFSFLILANIFSVLLLYDYINDISSNSDIYSFSLILISIFVVIGLPLKSIKEYKGEIPYISSPILISHGIFSYLYPNLEFTSSIPLFWITGGVFLLDIGIRWFEKIEKRHSIILGIGIYLLFMFIYWFMEGAYNIVHQITILSWAGFGLFLIITRFTSNEKRKKIYSGLIKGSISAVSIFFIILAWILITADKYIEALIELILSALFIFSLYNYEKDIKSVLIYGLPLSILTLLTLLSIFFF